MGKYIVELYVEREDDAALERGIELTRRAAERLTREGTRVRHLRSLFVPEDETCYLLFEARDAHRTAIRLDRERWGHLVWALPQVPIAPYPRELEDR